MNLLGWIGTALVLFSFTMKDMIKLRIINLAGCLIWIMYGLSKNDYPVMVTNTSIAAVHIYSIAKNYYRKEE